jgi:hypothetical protein
MDTQVFKNSSPQDLKGKRSSHTVRSLQEILHVGAGRFGAPPRGGDVTGDTFAGTTAKSRNEPLIQNLPEPKSRAYPWKSMALTHQCSELAKLANL